MRLKDLQLNTSSESLVWKLASEHYGAALRELLVAAVRSFKRTPGLDGLTRMYGQDIGVQPLALLVDTLANHAPGRFRVEHGGVEIRVSLRSHLLWFLRQSLVDDGYASNRLRDEHFAVDLGV